MGIYVGPLPYSKITNLLQEHSQRAASWRTRYGIYQWSDLLRYPAANPPTTLYGMPVLIDPNLSEGTVELCDAEGAVLGRIVDGHIEVPTIGPTTRLPRLCRECQVILPDDAKFCIDCGAPA